MDRYPPPRALTAPGGRFDRRASTLNAARPCLTIVDNFRRAFHFHDLRHHAATLALNANFSAPIVQQLGGWKMERMMRRYAAVTDKTLRAAAEAVSGGNVHRMARAQ